jgi:hypothetical protein
VEAAVPTQLVYSARRSGTGGVAGILRGAMKTTHRSYSEEAGDFNLLAHFFIGYHDHVRANSTWCLGRLVDWKYGLYDNKMTVAAFCDHNAHLWFDAFGDLAGFAISENGDGGFAILAAEGYRFLFAGILGWVLDHWGGRPPGPSIEITERQATEAAALERCGFRRASTFSSRCFDLTAGPIEPARLEPGFTIVDMAAHPIIERRACCAPTPSAGSRT